MFTCFAATSGDTPFEQAPVTENLVWSICSEVGREWRRLGAALRHNQRFWIILILISKKALKRHGKCFKSGGKKRKRSNNGNPYKCS